MKTILIIAPSDVQNVYWLNPTIVCKGERFAKYTEYMLDKTGETDFKIQQKERFEALPDTVSDKLTAMNKAEEYRQMNIFGGSDPIE